MAERMRSREASEHATSPATPLQTRAADEEAKEAPMIQKPPFSWPKLGSFLGRRRSRVGFQVGPAVQPETAKQSQQQSSNAYANIVEGLPTISEYTNFLWSSGARRESDSEPDDEVDRHSASVLRRSDPSAGAKESEDDSDSCVVPVDESAALGYMLSEESAEIQQLDSSSWDSAEQPGSPQAINWNSEWQRVTKRIREFNPQTTSAEQSEAFADLISLSEDFLLTVQAYGRIIISEAHLPTSEKTVQPTKLGGVIGGQKYLVQGILFKFSSDSNNIFGADSDVSSAKISGHELKGLLAAATQATPELNLPLIALVDYKGFRLVAMTQLPISPNTLAVGSSDGGLTVVNKNDRLNQQMARLGAGLNLKGHLCGATVEGSQFLYTPLDLEGHVGTDGKHYLCDFSRIMPPEMPRQKGLRQAYLYQLLRREFVTSLDKPLCSDAFSQFTRVHDAHVKDNEEVEAASAVLLEVVIPRVAMVLPTLLHSNPDKHILSFRLSAALHSHGVNMRHLFRVLELTEDADVKVLLMVEMVARVVGADIRDKLRRTTRTLPLALESHYLKVLCDRMNLIFGNTMQSVSYWNKKVRKRLWAKFCVHLGPSPSVEIMQRHPYFQRTVSFKASTMNHTLCETPAVHLLFVRLQQILGFHLKPLVEAQVTSAVLVKLCSRTKPFRPTDWSGLGMRIKHMNMVSYAKGFLFLTQGLAARASDPARARSLLAASIKHFEDCLSANTTFKQGLRACAKALMYYEFEMRLAEKKVDRKSSGSDLLSNHSKPSSLLTRADLYCRRAIEADVKDAQSYYEYAVFLDRLRDANKAEFMYRQALEYNPHHVDTLKSYGDFLAEQKREVEAEAMYLAAREHSRKLTESDVPKH